jgi:hypothetical protein
MTPKQTKQFEKLCKDMASLLAELHQGDHPDAVLFLEDGTPALYDWPGDIDYRPDDALAYGCYWPKAGGGGR